MNSVQSLLEPFIACLYLGMLPEAKDELDKLPTKIKTHPDVLEAKLCLLDATSMLEDQALEDGVQLGKLSLKLWPLDQRFYVLTTHFLNEQKKAQEAKEILKSAPASIRDAADFSYQLARCEAQLGNLDQAKRLLKECFAKVESYRERFLSEPEFAPFSHLWN
jgi:predicted Zn-dependent protease